jgi:hypothetical protein
MTLIQSKQVFFLAALILTIAGFSNQSFASDPQTPAGVDTAVAPSQDAHIKYKTGKDVDFEELLIQGRLKRPEITIVTGDSGNGTDGLLKLRENFVDRMSVDMAEEVK